ncbi:MAG TPA: hypothetical protein VL049_27785 [Candidatus Dormibacteraeota bacterium]|nr:hypothetical protein [Candidatus Dormibacteraeota bacterium]
MTLPQQHTRSGDRAGAQGREPCRHHRHRSDESRYFPNARFLEDLVNDELTQQRMSRRDGAHARRRLDLPDVCPPPSVFPDAANVMRQAIAGMRCCSRCNVKPMGAEGSGLRGLLLGYPAAGRG